jgi:hypothetical protein
MDNNKSAYTNRQGELVEVESFTISASAMTSIHRLKEDFEQRGEHLSLQGVVLHVLDKGISATRHYWNASEQNKNKREFAKQAAGLFNAQGEVTDLEALKALAIAKGLVKGSPKQV